MNNSQLDTHELQVDAHFKALNEFCEREQLAIKFTETTIIKITSQIFTDRGVYEYTSNFNEIIGIGEPTIAKL